jgi:hypothetical protein
MTEACGTGMTRVLMVIITGIAWFSISNHCALAELQAAAKAKASCHQPCCGDRAPARNKTENATECCKTLRATLAEAKDFAGYDGSLFALQPYFVRPIASTDDFSAKSRVLELDTGPPFANTFAESVLQRSILAHAPPVLA